MSLFREPSSNPIWLVRARKLASLMERREYRVRELLYLASSELNWAQDHTRNVLAAGEGTLLIEAQGSWRSVLAYSERPTVREEALCSSK